MEADVEAVVATGMGAGEVLAFVFEWFEVDLRNFLGGLVGGSHNANFLEGSNFATFFIHPTKLCQTDKYSALDRKGRSQKWGKPE